MPAKASQHTGFAMEALEPRLLMSGNVTVEVKDGWLNILGDRSANQITIDQTDLPSGQFRISAGDADTTINGSSQSQVFEGVRDVRVDLGEGDDKLSLTGLSSIGHARIDMGNGADDLKLSNSAIDGGFWLQLGEGNDSFLAKETTFRGSVRVWGNNGDDSIAFDDGSAPHVWVGLMELGTEQTFRKTVGISGGSGNDTLLVRSRMDQFSARRGNPAFRLNGGKGHDELSWGMSIGYHRHGCEKTTLLPPADLTAPPLAVSDSGDYYWHEDKKMPLMRQAGEVVFAIDGFKDDLSNLAKLLPGYRFVRKVADGIYVFRTPGGNNGSFNPSDYPSCVKWASPVFYNNGIVIPTNEVIISFDSAESMRSFAKHHEDTLIDCGGLGLNTRIFALREGGGVQALALANRLHGKPHVEWATPNFYSEIRFDV